MNKKIISLLLVFVFIFTFAASAFADEDQAAALEEAKAKAVEAVLNVTAISNSDVIRRIAKDTIERIEAAETVEEVQKIESGLLLDLGNGVLPSFQGIFHRVVTVSKNIKWMAALISVFLWFEFFTNFVFKR